MKPIGDFHPVIYFTPALSHPHAVPLGQSWERVCVCVGVVVCVYILHASVTVSAYLAVPLCDL